MLSTVSVVEQGRKWAVKHNGGVLGFTDSEGEALSIARSLLDWFDNQGRPAELVHEPRSWAPGETEAV